VVEINANFNAGLVWLPRNAISQSLFASLLEKWDPKFDTYQTEQTLFSALVSSANGISLPVKTNVLSWQGVWFYEMIFRVQEFKQDTMLGQLGIECI
jgi:hypothetical protein